MKTIPSIFAITLLPLMLFVSGCDFIKKHKKIDTVYIPEHETTRTFDTSITVPGHIYQVSIRSNYGSTYAPSRLYKDPHGPFFYRYYRDLKVDISISENGISKFQKKGFGKADFAKKIPEAFLDSAVMSPVSFTYEPSKDIFVFGAHFSVPDSKTQKATGLVVDKDFKANYIVAAE